jgi:hypothetical protein
MVERLLRCIGTSIDWNQSRYAVIMGPIGFAV